MTPFVNSPRKFLKFIVSLVPNLCLLYIIYSSISLSSSLSTRYKIHGLLPSPYISNTKEDSTDQQVLLFLSMFPTLSSIFTIIQLLLYCFRPTFKIRLLILSISGILFSIYLHGSGFIFLFFTLMVNYQLIYLLSGHSSFPGIFLTLNIILIILTNLLENFAFWQIWEELEFIDLIFFVIRWNWSEKILILKILSFGFDLHWMKAGDGAGGAGGVGVHSKKCGKCKNGKDCIQRLMKENAEEYSCLSYMGYCFYPYLNVMGPVLSYNFWLYQMKKGGKCEFREILNELTLVLAGILALFGFMHFIYFPALSNDLKNYYLLDRLEFFQVFQVGFMILFWNIFKFLVMWKFFSFWALFDGIKTEKTLKKIKSSDYSIKSFLMFFNYPFNQWLMRYIVRKNNIKNLNIFETLLCSGFYAIWFDFSYLNIALALLVALVASIEIKLIGKWPIKFRAEYKLFAAYCFLLYYLFLAFVFWFAFAEKGINLVLNQLSNIGTWVWMISSVVLAILWIKINIYLEENPSKINSKIHYPYSFPDIF